MEKNFTPKIIRHMPPPSSPPETNVDWQAAQEVMGIDYPDDFKDFVHTYGSLVWCDTFRTVYPGVDRQACEEYRAHIAELLEPLEYLYDDSQELKFGRYPEQGGLLPCMIDFNGKTICWITQGQPNTWGILVWMRGPCKVFRDHSMTQLILEWIEQKGDVKDIWLSELLDPEQFKLTE